MQVWLSQQNPEKLDPHSRYESNTSFLGKRYVTSRKVCTYRHTLFLYRELSLQTSCSLNFFFSLELKTLVSFSDLLSVNHLSVYKVLKFSFFSPEPGWLSWFQANFAQNIQFNSILFKEWPCSFKKGR